MELSHAGGAASDGERSYPASPKMACSNSKGNPSKSCTPIMARFNCHDRNPGVTPPQPNAPTPRKESEAESFIAATKESNGKRVKEGKTKNEGVLPTGSPAMSLRSFKQAARGGMRFSPERGPRAREEEHMRANLVGKGPVEKRPKAQEGTQPRS